jgi:hypothetical protein
MLGKVANVQLTAYQSGSADPNSIIKSNLAILGGQFVRTGRYLPSSARRRIFNKSNIYGSRN